MTYIETNGVRTWYAEHGSGEPLVYLHGGWSDAREFDDERPRFAERFRVLTPERRGHGRTPDHPVRTPSRSSRPTPSRSSRR